MIFTKEPPFKKKDGLTKVHRPKSDTWIVRTKSSLDADRVNNDPAFKPLIAEANILKIASPLASAIYRSLKVKDKKLYFKIVGMAQRLLRAGHTTIEVTAIIQQ